MRRPRGSCSSVYRLGQGISFFVIAILLPKGLGRLEWVRKRQLGTMRAGWVMLVVLGVLLLCGFWTMWINRSQDFEVLI